MDSLSQILEALKRRYPKLGLRWQEAQHLSRWEEVVGPGIARHARTLRVENKVLWVEVDHPLWKAELHHRKRQILERLAKLAGESPGFPVIEDLRCTEKRGRSGPS